MEGNAHSDAVNTDAGGIRITGEAQLTLVYSSIIVNTAGRGGGIAGEGFGSGGSVSLTNSTVTRNTAHNSGGGGIEFGFNNNTHVCIIRSCPTTPTQRRLPTARSS